MSAFFSMMFLIIVMKYLGGMIALSHCRINGMFSIGKINPESRIEGSMRATSEIIMATCCVLVAVEMRMPSDSATMMYKMLSAKRRRIFPWIGIPNTNFPKSRMIIALMNERRT
jgi:hypothetical protein